jgi:hypothetical protein
VTPRSRLLGTGLLIWLLGCDVTNRGYLGATPSCTSNAQCAGTETPVCSGATCVQCTEEEASACGGTTPVCGRDNSCRGCTAHSDCASQACLPDGSCGTDGNVAYVAPTGMGAVCSLAAPCKTVTEALATPRPYVKLSGTTKADGTVVTDRTVTFVADPGAKLTPASIDATVLKVEGSSRVEIYDLEITGGSGTTGIGVLMPMGNTSTVKLARVKLTNNTGGGISATGGSVTVEQSVVSGNTGGGISVTGGTFDIRNNFIVKNGGAMSTVGGVIFSQINTTNNRFAFNTVSQNIGSTNVSTGVLCAAVTAAQSFANNIVYGNPVNGMGKQVEGANCNWSYSAIGPGTDIVSGTGNLMTAPTFVDAASNDFHLQSGSVGKDVADPAATELLDIDGEARPQGARRDMGADEVAQ